MLMYLTPNQVFPFSVSFTWSGHSELHFSFDLFFTLVQLTNKIPIKKVYKNKKYVCDLSISFFLNRKSYCLLWKVNGGTGTVSFFGHRIGDD